MEPFRLTISNVKVEPLTLAFPGSLESDFLKDYFQNSISHVRIATIVAIFFYSVFGALDFLLVPQEKEIFWAIRFFFFVPFLVLVFGFSFTKYYERFIQPANAISIIFAGFGIIVMIMIAPPPAKYLYYAGLILVLVFGYTFFKLRFLWASLAGWLVVLTYEVTALLITHDTPTNILISNNFFFLASNILGMFACYSIELYSRKDFVQRRELERERRKVNAANIELENRVAERTYQLLKANEELTLEVIERKRKEEALRISEEKYRSILENMEEGYFEVDLTGTLTFFNQATCRILGYSKDELLGASYRKFTKSDTTRKMTRMFSQVYRTGVAAKVTDYKINRKSGKLRYLALSTSPIWDSDGKMAGFRGIGRDDTDRMLAEEEVHRMNDKLELLVEERTEQLNNVVHELKSSLDTIKNTQKQLVETEKMAALGSLVAGVAHEINTPVGVAITAASLLEEKTQIFRDIYTKGGMKRSDLESYVQTATESTAYVLSNILRAADLIRSFKQVAVDQSSEEKRRFFIKEYIENILLSLNPKLKRTRHQIQLNCQKELAIESYPGAFSQIITNLVMNSLIHGFDGIEVGHIRFDISRENNTLRMRYEDDGVGMKAATVSNIFEPFYTTKRGTGGSGLGMHIVYNVVTQTLKGKITCISEPKHGTAFEIIVPLD